MEEAKTHSERKTCRTCEYFDYRGVEIARAAKNHTGYICSIKSHGTSGDKLACSCYLAADTPMTPQEKQRELIRVKQCRKGVSMRIPRKRNRTPETYQQDINNQKPQ